MTIYKVNYILNAKLNVIYFLNEEMAKQWVDTFDGALEEIFVSTNKKD